MTDWKERAFRSALRMIENGDPKDLVVRAQPDAADRGETLSSADLSATLSSVQVNSPFLNALGMQIHKWDAAEADQAWTDGTPPSSIERRLRICNLLGIDESGCNFLLASRPIFHDETVVITAPWDRWYSPERASEREFYWPRYRDYLLGVKKWDTENVASLDLATNDIVERLNDPTRPEAHQSKGLVVGYVQSGKTANFTGVIAKSIDAGYRLIIVMTGTIEMLRSQTQRRIDMEMVGTQNILGDIPVEQASSHGIDYVDDDEWKAGRFLDLGQSPATEIHRLTTHHADYRHLGAQFQSLKIERAVPALPLYHPENLFKSAARLAIVKKNSSVLKKLVANVKANQKAFSEIPVLIIDDESDEASVNTVDPEKVKEAKAEGKEIKERKAINARIAEMLELMPRAQYVGYTATPFANVFTDPSDPLGIFPKDFVIGLRRPPGYMGVDDFHDFEEADELEKDHKTSNELAFVRHLEAPEDDLAWQDRELRIAMDMFVLTGAVKLFRSDRSPELRFKHHTMLIHHSVKKDDHWELADRVKALWSSSEYSKPSGKARLRVLYDTDVLPVSLVRQGSDLPGPPNFDELAAFIPQAIARITEHANNPIIVVNSDKDIDNPVLDFDKTSTWRILIGGAKLSRGFTVEGLTVTFFRRATNMSASLTQMGRWFGFRDGYRDLVRLYIARRAIFARKEVDIYEAFAGVAKDEGAFRQQLEQYAEWDGDKPRVLPSQIPPLVTQHLSWLLPTAKNKMFNAVLVEQGDQAFTPVGYANDADELLQNLNLWRQILSLADTPKSLPQGSLAGSFEALVGVAPAQMIIEAIEAMHYLPFYKARTVTPRITFYRRLMNDDSLKDFLVIVPQPKSETVQIETVGARSVVSRDRRSGRGFKFGEITEPKHRPSIASFVTSTSPSPRELQSLDSPTRGAILVYLAKESKDKAKWTHSSTTDLGSPECGLVVAYSVYLPTDVFTKYPSLIQFRVRDHRDEHSPIVDENPMLI